MHRTKRVSRTAESGINFRIPRFAKGIIKDSRSLICLSLVMLLSLTTLFTACETNDTAYHKYISINGEGWVNSDTLVFRVDTLRRYGDYTTYVCLRTRHDFPYRYLSVIVDQTVMPKTRSKHREVTVEIVNRDGAQEGTGINHRIYEVPLFTEWLGPGDSVRIAIKHNMSRETMPGIIDVGVKLKR